MHCEECERKIKLLEGVFVVDKMTQKWSFICENCPKHPASTVPVGEIPARDFFESPERTIDRLVYIKSYLHKWFDPEKFFDFIICFNGYFLF